MPQHRRQLERAQTLIEQAEHNGHQRMAEMNRIVEKIGGLTAPNCCASAKSCGCTGQDRTDAN